MDEIRAQMLYRSSRFAEARAVYDAFEADDDDEFALEREANALACSAGQAAAGDGMYVSSSSGKAEAETYEQSYNLACIAISEARYADALVHLERATEQCKELLEEDPDTTEEEIDEEVALLRVQTGVALQWLGRDAGAMEHYTHVLKTKPDDLALVAIASMNIIALNHASNCDSRLKSVQSGTSLRPRQAPSFCTRIFRA